MKNLVSAVGVLGLLGGFVACGADDNPPQIGEGGSRSTSAGTTGKPNKGGTGAGGGNNNMGGAGGELVNGSTSPLVSITSPVATSDPVDEEVIIGAEVTVVCLAVRSRNQDAAEVDPSTVQLTVLDANGEPALGVDAEPLEKPGVPTGSANEYEATFSTTSIESGVVSFRCTASDVGGAAEGSDTMSTFLDQGPTILAKLPAVDSTHKPNGVMAVEFSVAEAPLTAGDTEAAVSSVTLEVAGKEIALTEDAKNPGTYRASVNFKDPILFPEPPTEHTSVRVEASNARTSTPATAVLDYPIIVDGKGPLIAYVSPADNDVIHGETTVVFTVEDAGAGVDEDSIVLTLTGLATPVKYAPGDTRWMRNGSTYSFRFDTGTLTDAQAQVTVSVRAQDNADNETPSLSLILWIDDQPPSIDLDPGNARGRDSQGVCSATFDPLGSALGDGAKTSVRFNLLRALIHDETNQSSGLFVDHMAGVNQKSARLYIQPDPTQPFLVDTDNDGICDNLANEDFKYQSLNPVLKQGQLTFSDTDFASAPAINPGGPLCTVSPPAAPAPKLLCEEASDLTVVVQHDVSSKGDEPVVYAMGALSDGFECTGSKWDLGLVVALDGWVCLAARAADNRGNVGISRPLRVCFDDPGVLGTPACMSSGAPPNCTTNCTAPPRYPAHIYRF